MAPRADGGALRDFVAADLPELLDLWAEAWSLVFPDIDFDARRGWFAEHLTAMLDDGGACRVAFRADDGEMAGFILIDPANALLDQICVAVRRQGGGLAGLLLAEARRLMPGGFELSVNQRNARAIRFYERQGLARVGEGVNPRSGLPTFRYRWRP
jgi:putative acetyltransferase